MDDLYCVPPLCEGLSQELDGRWYRAGCFARCGHSPDGADDRETRIAAEYLRDRECGGRRPPRGLRETWSAIDAARALAGRDDPAPWELEARLLAGQDDREIGRRCGLDPAVVHWHEALFFRVRNMLRVRDWVAARTFGPALWTDSMKLGDVWQAVAYSGGPAALDVMLAATADMAASGGESPRDRQTFPQELIEGARLLALALMMPAATSTAHWAKLLEQGGRVESMRRPSAVAAAIARESARLVEATRPIPAENPNRKSRRAGVA